MSTRSELEALERVAYREAYSDGIFDLFFGLSLVWIGAAWLWLPDYSGLAGVLPAIFIAPVIEARKRFVEPRIGYVKWSESRARQEQRGLVQILGVGVLMLVGGVAVYLWFETGADSEVMDTLVPALPSLLLALGAGLLGLVAGIPRAVGYAAILVGAGFLTILREADPGLDMFVSGTVITAIAVGLIVSFVRHHPVSDAT